MLEDQRRKEGGITSKEEQVSSFSPAFVSKPARSRPFSRPLSEKRQPTAQEKHGSQSAEQGAHPGERPSQP
ncbi:hypothetical protein MRX96_026778 [Rhipicephalus microplus]